MKEAPKNSENLKEDDEKDTHSSQYEEWLEEQKAIEAIEAFKEKDLEEKIAKGYRKKPRKKNK